MKGKILILLVTLVFLFASGCAEEDNTSSVPDDSEIPLPEAGEDISPEENMSLKPGEVYVVRLENLKVIKPSELNISRGDTVSWWSEKRQGNYVLVSEDGLFPDKTLSYSVPFTYTFNETGTYSFIVKDVPGMNATIRVN